VGKKRKKNRIVVGYHWKKKEKTGMGTPRENGKGVRRQQSQENGKWKHRLGKKDLRPILTVKKKLPVWIS